MNRMTNQLLLLAATLAFLAGHAEAGNRVDGRNAQPSRLLERGHSVVFDANNISTYIRNNGSFDRNPITGNAGYEWPRGTGNTAIYASGLWLGGKRGGTVRVAVAEYAYEFDAGPIATGIDPNDPRWRVYKIKAGDNAGNNIDYAQWPAADGAPFNDLNHNGVYEPVLGETPMLFGDMTVWAVFNDNNPALHTNMNTPPLGIEVQLTAYAYNLSNALGNSIFYKWKLINKSGQQIDSTFVTVWSDVDLGDSGDDYDGCDTTLGLGYTYNGNPVDGVYGSAPPATGFDFLQGPLVPGAPTDTARFPDGRTYPGKKLLRMTSSISYTNDATELGNPNTGQEVFNYQKGLTRSGLQILNNNNNPTTFMFPGDPNLPLSSTNWIESAFVGDRRILMSAGPFTMAPGDTQEIVAANLIARGTNYHNSVTALKNADFLVQQVYENNTTSLPQFAINVAYPTGFTAALGVLANARLARADSIGVRLTRRDGSVVGNLQLFDDGVHGDSAAHDGIWGNSVTITREPQGMYLDLFFRDSLGRHYSYARFLDQITTVGSCSVANPLVFSDNLNNNGVVNPGENVRYGITVTNGSPGSLNGLTITPSVFYSSAAKTIGSINSGGSFSWTYNPSDPNTYFDFQVTSIYPDSFFVIQMSVTDTMNNRWDGVIRFPVVQLTSPPYGSPVTHTAGASEWLFNVLSVDPPAIQNHLYEISIVDSIAPGPTTGFTLRDLTVPNTLLFNHELPDLLSQNIPLTQGFKVMQGYNFGMVGMRADSTRWISPNPVWLQGYRFTVGPPAGFDGGVTIGSDLPNYLGAVAPQYNWSALPRVEVRFSTTTMQKAYRLRRVGGVGTAYVIQAVNPFVDIPFTVWDMSGPTPRQLTVAWRDQDDGSTWNPQVGSDGTEVVFIYSRTYNPLGHQWPYQNEGGDPAVWSNACTVGAQADIMYGLGLAVLTGHVLNESPGTLYLRPWLGPRSSDRFTFNPTIVLAVKNDETPAIFSLDQNYPNPFNPNTTIRFSIPKHERVSLKIYNILGQEVATLVNDELSAGSHILTWQGTNHSNHHVATGVYFYRLEAGSFSSVKKLLLLK